MTNLPNKDLFRVEEVAEYFSVTCRTIYLWIEHEHLKVEKIKGISRIPRESILKCRFNIKESSSMTSQVT
jgi:excisionase family DNA binding protein